MRRDQAEALLEAQDISFHMVFKDGRSWDQIPLGRRPSGVWYCGPIQLGVSIDFGTSAPDVIAQDSDKVVGVGPYEYADNCL